MRREREKERERRPVVARRTCCVGCGGRGGSPG